MPRHRPPRHTVPGWSKRTLSLLPLLFTVVLAPAPALGQGGAAPPETAPRGDTAVVTTPHFALHSDPAMNLFDALVTAGVQRNGERPELFQEGPEAECFAALPEVERAGWNRAVDLFAEAVSSQSFFSSARSTPRLFLAGVFTRPDEETERRRLEVVLGMHRAAEPAYRACRWPAQDRANRAWIEAVAERLAAHEEALAQRMTEVFQRPWAGIPLRVDVVETAGRVGANTLNLREGAHTLISSSNPGYRGPAALEMVFHEAGHFFTGRGTAVPEALAEAAHTQGRRFGRDVIHAVHFWLVGEVARRALTESGGDYQPYAERWGVYAEHLPTVARIWRAYLDGERSLEEAAAETISALGEPVPGGG